LGAVSAETAILDVFVNPLIFELFMNFLADLAQIRPLLATKLSGIGQKLTILTKMVEKCFDSGENTCFPP